MPGPHCSIIIPVLNDGQAMLTLLRLLQPVRQQGHEILVVDGGSEDQPGLLAKELADRFLLSSPGRARQMNHAAQQASGEIFWFLHADSQLDVEAGIEAVMSLLDTNKVWGRFDVRLSGRDWRLRIVETMMNWRSRLTGIATGDQGIFIRRDAFRQMRGFADIPLMEDVAISRSLKRLSAPLRLRQSITTSSRRWETRGIVRTILLMWALRLAYTLGVSPQKLSRYYKSCSSPMQNS